MTGVAIAVAFILIFGAVRAVIIVPNGFVYVIERLGRYRETLHAGLNVIMPLLDRVAYKYPTAAQAEELSNVCETLDQRHATFTALFRFIVLDARRASYGSANYREFLRALVRTTQKRYVESQNWESLREDHRSLQQEVLRNVEAPADSVGVKVLEYELRKLELQTRA